MWAENNGKIVAEETPGGGGYGIMGRCSLPGVGWWGAKAFRSRHSGWVRRKRGRGCLRWTVSGYSSRYVSPVAPCWSRSSESSHSTSSADCMCRPLSPTKQHQQQQLRHQKRQTLGSGARSVGRHSWRPTVHLADCAFGRLNHFRTAELDLKWGL